MVDMWLTWLLGVAVGVTITLVVIAIKSSLGKLLIDRSNPNKDVYRIDIGHIENLHKKKYVWLKVDPNADLSQK